MKRLLRLALAADGVALLTVVLGSWTRINGAGLTCPDWPLCHGRLIPNLGDGTVWEWLHRLLASTVAPLVLWLVIVAWQQRRSSPFVAPTLAAIVLLFLVQLGLGAETVRLANTPYSVVLHWGTAMALIAALSAMAAFAALPPARDESSPPVSSPLLLAIVLALTASAAFATMCIGAYVSSSGAGLACLSIPGCAGNVVVYTPGQFVQMLHRIAAAVTLLCATGALSLSWALPASKRVRSSVAAGAVLVAVQILLGLLNVALRLPTDLREAHAINAALLFLAFFLACVFAVLDATPLRARTLPQSGVLR